MKKTEPIVKRILIREIIRALRYLEGGTVDSEREKQFLEASAPRLIQEAQLIREAVMLRQQCEAAEHVRDTIQAEKAMKRLIPGRMPS